MRNVLVAIDGSSCSNASFRWAAENFLRTDDNVILLHAAKDFRALEPPNADGKKAVWKPEEIQQYQQRVEQQARLLVEQYTSHPVAEHMKCEAVIAIGDARKVILEHIDKYQPAAVVMGSRGLGLLQRSILGSVSDYVLHNSTAPVIIVREKVTD